jgi:hypothetical protein
MTTTASTSGKTSVHRHDDMLSLREFVNEAAYVPPPDDGTAADHIKRNPVPDDEVTIVTWRDATDPQDPKNWSKPRKWAIVALASALTFLSVASSAMMAPDLRAIGADLRVPASDSATPTMLLSVFLLSGAVGPLFFAPLSEVLGRLPVLHGSTALFAVFNLACAYARSGGEMLAFRFAAGFGSSAMMSLASGVLADCFDEVSGCRLGPGRDVWCMI